MRGLRRIEPAFGERIAAANAPHSADGAAEGAVFLHRQNEVVAASRLKAAPVSDQRADGVLIYPHHADEQRDGKMLHNGADPAESVHQRFSASFRATRFPRRGNDTSKSASTGSTPWRGRTTKSMPTGRLSRESRNASRKSRFQRLLLTAPPTFLDTESPRRGNGKPLEQPKTTNRPSEAAQRRPNARWNSLAWRIRYSARKRCSAIASTAVHGCRTPSQPNTDCYTARGLACHILFNR